MQEIIVYRNPAEAAFWNSVSSGEAFPVFGGIFIFFVVFFAIFYIGGKYVPWKHQKRMIDIALLVGAIAGILTCWKMWI